MQGRDIEILRYVPAWLSADQLAPFTERLRGALDHHGWPADALTRGRIIGGVAVAFKGNRLNSEWGRRMLAKRGGQARLRAVAESGEQTRAVYAALGRRGGQMSQAVRRDREHRRLLATVASRIRMVLAARGRQAAPTGFREWMR